MGILAFLIILSVLVFVHELGHFFTARRFGITVDEFGLGLPPRAYGIKRGKTIFSLNWIPLGGFVKIKGEQGENPDDTDSFTGRPIWQRSIVISAGVIMNVILAFILLAYGFTVGTPQIIDSVDLKGATVIDKKIIVASVFENFPAGSVDIQRGDAVLAINDTEIGSIEQMQTLINNEIGNPVTLVLNRENERIVREITPVMYTGEDVPLLKDDDEERGIIGVQLLTTGIVSYSVPTAIIKGFTTTMTLLKDIVLAFSQIIRDLVVGEKVSVELSGPVGIAVITTQITKLGYIYVIQFAALLSLNLAIINFIPFPALDGGRFLFLMIEKIKGRPVNQKVETMIHNIGFGLLMVLIIIVTARDLSNINFWEKVSGIF